MNYFLLILLSKAVSDTVVSILLILNEHLFGCTWLISRCGFYFFENSSFQTIISLLWLHLAQEWIYVSVLISQSILFLWPPWFVEKWGNPISSKEAQWELVWAAEKKWYHFFFLFSWMGRLDSLKGGRSSNDIVEFWSHYAWRKLY